MCALRYGCGSVGWSENVGFSFEAWLQCRSLTEGVYWPESVSKPESVCMPEGVVWPKSMCWLESIFWSESVSWVATVGWPKSLYKTETLLA